MTTYEIIAVALSAIALAFSLGAIIKDIIIAVKNRITPSTLTVAADKLTNEGGLFNDWVHCDLIITNHTRKEFTIGRISATVNSKPCRVWQVIEKSNKGWPPSKVGVIPPFRVMPHDIINIDFYIETAPLDAPTYATLSVHTSYRKVNYRILIPCQSKNNGEKTQQ